MKLAGKVVVVTGAAGGIGRPLCAALGREGACLGLLDRNGEGLAALAAELEAAGVNCARASADVCDRQAVQAAIRALAGQLGSVDILVACAGIGGATLVDDLAVEATEALVQINLLGTAYAINAVLPDMLARRSGQIVGISSLAGRRGMPYMGGYCAGKAAMMKYLESLRPSLRRRGIAVTTVVPGFVDTPLLEAAKVQRSLPRMEPERAARHIVKAILRRSRVYTFPWSAGLAIGMMCWLPPWVYDWVMTRVAALDKNLRY